MTVDLDDRRILAHVPADREATTHDVFRRAFPNIDTDASGCVRKKVRRDVYRSLRRLERAGHVTGRQDGPTKWLWTLTP